MWIADLLTIDTFGNDAFQTNIEWLDYLLFIDSILKV